MNHSVKLEWEK